jgi:acetyltransferase
MSIRHLDRLLEPRSVAVIGASNRPGSVGATVWRNLRAGTFAGPLFGVNPKHATLEGVKLARRVADLLEPPDLAVLCTPPATVPTLVEEPGRLGTRAAIVMTAGLTDGQKRATLDGGDRLRIGA